MLDSVSGKVLSYEDGVALVELGAVVFSVFCLSEVNNFVGEVRRFFIHLQWSQDSAPKLFGFLDCRERDLFRIILSVHQIGPALALDIMRNLTAEQFVSAIEESKPELLCGVKGIGKKKAEQIVFALKGKLGGFIERFGETLANSSSVGVFNELSSLLSDLGYRNAQISFALNKIRSKVGEKRSEKLKIEELLKIALREITTSNNL